MVINYWKCEFNDADYDSEEDLWTYKCEHPNGNGKCDLDNKWCNDKRDCKLLDLTPQDEQGFTEKLIYEWTAPGDYVHTKCEDIATAYRVYACQEAQSGIIVYSLYRGEWMANAGSMRPLIKTLINQLDQLKERTEKK